MKRIFLLFVIILLLTGCASKTEVPFEKGIVTYPPADAADFSLPEGYIFSDNSTATIIRTEDNLIIGGILNTGLDPDCLEEKDSVVYHRYLLSLGHMCEYISMNADGFKSVSLYITDEGSAERKVTNRCIFPMGEECYDLWFDAAVVSDEEEKVIRKTIIGK